MPKLPSMQWYTGDWMKSPDVGMMNASARGVWFDWLNSMHELDQCGQVTGTIAQLARIGRCTLDEVEQTLVELSTTKAGEVKRDCHGVVTVTNRRMFDLYERRISDLNRKRKERGKPLVDASEAGSCDALSRDCHDDVTRPSSSSSSSSSSHSSCPARNIFRLTEPEMDDGGWKAIQNEIKTAAEAMLLVDASKGKSNPPGWIVEHVRHGYRRPTLIPQQAIRRWANEREIVKKICGFPVAARIGVSNGFIMIGEHRVNNSQLTLEAIEFKEPL